MEGRDWKLLVATAAQRHRDSGDGGPTPVGAAVWKREEDPATSAVTVKRGSRCSQPASAAMELSGWLLGPLGEEGASERPHPG
jgi:hypothetical protein